MSNHHLDAAFAALVRGPAKAVLIVLANRANKKGQCWPSAESIAADAGCSVATVNRAIPKLRESGLIDVQPRFHPGGGLRTSSLYTVKISRSVRETERSVTEIGPLCQSDRAAISERQTRSVTVIDKPSKNPNRTHTHTAKKTPKFRKVR